MTSPFDPNLPPNYPQGPRHVVYLEASRDPFIAPDTNLTSKDTKYRDGSWYQPSTEWKNTSVTPPRIWKLAKIVNKTTAQWQLISGSSGVVTDLRGDDGAIATPNLGVIDVLGFVVANASNAKAVFTDNSTTPNTSRIEVQLAAAISSSDVTKVGLASFNSGQFFVDPNGFVSLLGGGQAIDTIGVQATSGTGTNPVVPSNTGNINVSGSVTTSGTNPLRSISKSPNSYNIEAQISQSTFGSDNTRVGLSNYFSEQFDVSTDGLVIHKSPGYGSGVTNLGIIYDNVTGVFTITSAYAIGLSSDTPGFVTLPVASQPGKFNAFRISTDASFTDATGASTIIGNTFGTTAALAYGNDIPFYLYYVANSNGNTVTPMLSRFPNTNISPVAGKIAKPGSAVANTQGSFFAFDASINVANYASQPCISVGSIRMKKNSSDNWTVTPLDSADGIGMFQFNRMFTLPTGQFGAATGKYFINNGGTAPSFTTSSFQYYIKDMSNFFNYYCTFSDCSVAGAGAVDLQLALPYNIAGGSHGSGYTATGVTINNIMIPTIIIPNSNAVQFAAIPAGTFFDNADVVLTVSINVFGDILMSFV